MSIKPWREIAKPHKDVLEGTFKQSEFAADISQVHSGTATPEYQDAAMFFSRTFITEGMRLLLQSVAERLSGRGGDPVIQLQTAFGGGKTHTLLAVYHLASRSCPTSSLAGIPAILDQARVAELPTARVAVIDGIKLSPSQPRTHSGTTVHTLWGELAVQLLGAEGFALVASADADGTSPGKEVLQQLISRAAPCVILVDELLAYIRQLEPGRTYKGGTYDSNLTFIQALTEAMKSVPNAILLASLPESEAEVGGAQGQSVLTALEKYFGRVESVWKPVATEEAFEIVRRRLFETVGDADEVRAVATAFGTLYRSNPTKFPGEAQEGRYEERMASSYPIHPEVFDRLYEDWSTLDKFQRTRGVLQYLAIVIHRLWNNGDKDPIILPASLPLDDANVRNKSIHYLPNGWEPVIEREIDGPRSEAFSIDGHDTRFGTVQAARRAARTIFLGSAPSNAAQTVRGIRVERVLLGTVLPGQSPGLYEDVIKRLRDKLHYLYGEQDSYWFDTRPNLRREMESRKANLKDADDVLPLLKERVAKLFGARHGFSGVHYFPASNDVPDEYGTGPRLVVLSPKGVYRRQDDSAARTEAATILEKRGDNPRLKRNRLIFLAPDGDAVGRLKDSVRTYLAWKSIVDDVANKRMDLGTYQADQAKRATESAMEQLGHMARETYRWLMAPAEEILRGKPTLRWEAVAVSPSAPNLADEIQNKLKEEEWVIYAWSPVHLNRILNQWYLKDGAEHISALKVWQDSCHYLYLPRLSHDKVFDAAIAAGCATQDGFAYASAVEDGKYVGFAFGRSTLVTLDSSAVLISPDAAGRYQSALDAESARRETERAPEPLMQGTKLVTPPGDRQRSAPDAAAAPKLPTRFFASTQLDPVTGALDFSKIMNEVVQHFSSLPGVEVELTVEIQATSRAGFDTGLQRTVKENCGVLKLSKPEFDD
jgi:uncharacterized protein